MEFDLTGNYPILLGGEETGTLTVSRDGLYWVFDAKCAPREELVRLMVFGADGSGYLGVMEPCGSSLVLTRRLSRSALAGYPTSITHAGEREDASAAVGSASPPESDYSGKEGRIIPTDEAKPPSFPVYIPPALSWLPCPCPCSLFSSPLEKSAFGSVRGALSARDNERTFLAVPVDAAAAMPYGATPFLFQAKFSGKLYLICIVENGKIIRSPA